METTTEVSEKLFLENLTERVEATHESYQSTSIDGKIIEESRTVVFESTQETITTVEQPIENNSFYPSVHENASILEQNKYAIEVNEDNTFSDNIQKHEDVLAHNVIENDPELILATESESESSLVINEKANENTSVNLISEIALADSHKTEGNEYMLEQQAGNVYMPEQKRDGVSLVSEQVYATEMISDDSQDNIFPNQGEQNSTEDSNILSSEGGTYDKNEDVESNTAELDSHNQIQTELDPLKCDTSNHPSEFIEEDDGTQTENVEESTVVEEVMQVQANEESDGIKEEGASVNVEQTKTEKQVLAEDIEEVNTVEHTTEIVDTSSTSNNLELTDMQDASSENVTLQNYTLPEGLEVTEIQEGEYQTEEGNSDGTLVLLQDYEHSESFEQSSEEDVSQLSDGQLDVYMKELRGQADPRESTSTTSPEVKRRRGRKPTYDIPMHVLGHDISKPVETVPNGRALPKPRLGVKVPYRNLTSQIVSKAEIEKEIMERARIKQEQAIAKGNVLFARKLTQRLARKIAPSPNHPKKVLGPQRAKVNEQQVEVVDEMELTDPLALEPHEVSASQEQQKINNDSDLLAILEGEGDDMPVLPKEVPQPIHDDVDVKMLEREIALQQLQELPHQEPTQRVFRGRHAKPEVRAPELTVEAPATTKTKTAEKTGSATKRSASPTQSSKRADQLQQAASNKENSSKRGKEPSVSSPRKDHVRIDLPPSPKKGSGDVEPQVKVNMVLKTYSRKRKTVELTEPFPESPSPKKPMLNEVEVKQEKADSTDVYVTKSSRVIKKKVIWDPDEVSVRSPRPSRGDSPAKTPKHSERIAEKKTSTEKAAKEKSPEKRPSEKLTPKRSIEKTASPAEKKHPKTESPKNSKTPAKYKKSLSEVDRLLMDEGAVKMLYELKNTDETASRKKKDVYSVERAQKELMKKANEIKNDLQQTSSSESPKSLRKKAEGFPAALLKPALIAGLGERKMSKDSTRSSLHTPPGSPAFSQSSMLVRRRSSSSISSGDDDTSEDNVKTRRKSAPDAPKSKKPKRSEEPQENESAKETAQPKAVDAKPNQFKSFTVKKSNKHIIIDLHYTDDNCYCTAEVLEELTIALKKYARDKDCSVVSITSSSKAFCSGLDYASLLSDKEEVRKKRAVELSGRVKDFLLCLLNFPKVLVAGIKGECVGLGVTMLPLFDMVIASDTATFSTPYARLGCVAEAGFLLSSPHLTNHGLAAELLFTTQKLTADDVFRRGLISRLCWPEKYNETLKTILMSISKGSKQSLETTKKQLRRHLVQSTEGAINAESKLLVEHWTGAECQKSFARLAEPRGN